MKFLYKKTKEQYSRGRRLCAPLTGFPGAPLTNSTIKICQQNHQAHYQALAALANRFEPDFIFPMMDLSVEANALGLHTLFPEDDSATPQPAGEPEKLLGRIPGINIEADSRALAYAQTIRLMKRHFPATMAIGAYITGPFTLAGQILEVSRAVLAALLDGEELHKLIKSILPFITQYAEMQIKAGADMLCILEPSAALLNPEQFKEFSADYVRSLAMLANKKDVDSIYHVCGNTMHLYRAMAACGISGLSLDSKEAGVNLPEIAGNVSRDIVLIGNLNPTGKLLYGKADEVQQEAQNLLSEMKDFPNFVLSSGCDLPKDTPLENIEAFMKAGKNYRLS